MCLESVWGCGYLLHVVCIFELCSVIVFFGCRVVICMRDGRLFRQRCEVMGNNGVEE